MPRWRVSARCMLLWPRFFNSSVLSFPAIEMKETMWLLMAMVKKRITTLPHDFIEEQFANLLSLYAFRFVEKQLALWKKVQIFDDGGVRCIVSSSASNLNVTSESCQSTFWSSMHVPCQHMFAVREKRKLPLSIPLAWHKGGSWRTWEMFSMED